MVLLTSYHRASPGGDADVSWVGGSQQPAATIRRVIIQNDYLLTF